MEGSGHFQFSRTSKCSYGAKADAWRQRSCEGKVKQLADWKTFDVYDEVEDLGQEKTTGTWVVVKKEIADKQGIRARWVAKEFQEEREIKADPPTVSKLGIRVLFAIAASKEWPLEVIDVKSAFLRGDELDRELYMEPPAEEKKPNVIWRLNKAVYGSWTKRCSIEMV